jgi:hypothetical protein
LAGQSKSKAAKKVNQEIFLSLLSSIKKLKTFYTLKVILKHEKECEKVKTKCRGYRGKGHE